MMPISKLRKPKHVIKLESTKFLLMKKYKTTIDIHKVNNKTSRTILISQQHSFQIKLNTVVLQLYIIIFLKIILKMHL